VEVETIVPDPENVATLEPEERGVAVTVPVGVRLSAELGEATDEDDIESVEEGDDESGVVGESEESPEKLEFNELVGLGEKEGAPVVEIKADCVGDSVAVEDMVEFNCVKVPMDVIVLRPLVGIAERVAEVVIDGEGVEEREASNDSKGEAVKLTGAVDEGLGVAERHTEAEFESTLEGVMVGS
jgi:hypothetical protein